MWIASLPQINNQYIVWAVAHAEIFLTASRPAATVQKASREQFEDRNTEDTWLPSGQQA